MQVVAGGKVTLRGLPPQTRTWTKVLDTPSDFDQETTFSVQVDADHVRNWAAGAEILFTSHTQAHDDQQVRKIFAISKSKSNPNVADILVLPAIKRPISARESPDFAVEVALLSRNIVFEGGHDSNENHGGHFWIMHTPEVAQTVEGIEVKNFGQQGSLGRYPIHFHYNNEGRGSVIARNTVRDSNQVRANYCASFGRKKCRSNQISESAVLLCTEQTICLSKKISRLTPQATVS